MKRLALLLLTACLDTSIDYTGKRCSQARPCPGELECSPVTQTCQPKSTCGPPLPMLCALRDVALAPGMAPPSLSPGDRLVLQDADYGALTLFGNGSQSCPIVVTGPARLTDTLTLDGSHFIVSDLTFEVPSRLYALKTGGKNLTLQRLKFSKTAASRSGSGEYPFDLYLDSQCGDVTVTQSEFTSERAPGIFSASTCGQITVKGNRFVTGRDGPTVQIEGPSGTVEGNELTGSMTFAAVEFVNGGTGIVRRNWFHDLSASGIVAVRNATVIESNTFTNVETAASCGTFENNLLQHVTNVTTCSTAARAYNLLDDAGPTTGATELSAAAQLGTDSVPDALSPAIDAADPKLPVPEGGGARADIGAFERGATRRPDGTYCAK